MERMPAIRDGEVVAAIVYRRVTRSQLIVPFSVFATVPGTGRFSEYDVEYSRRDHALCYNNSGFGGRFYLGRFVESPRRGVPVWWDRELATPTDGGKVDGPTLTDRTLKKWGYAIVAEPLKILGTEQRNPLRNESFDYSLIDSKTTWCKHCRSFIPELSDEPCSHLSWSDSESEFKYVRR